MEDLDAYKGNKSKMLYGNSKDLPYDPTDDKKITGQSLIQAENTKLPEFLSSREQSYLLSGEKINRNIGPIWPIFDPNKKEFKVTEFDLNMKLSQKLENKPVLKHLMKESFSSGKKKRPRRKMKLKNLMKSGMLIILFENLIQKESLMQKKVEKVEKADIDE